MECRTTFFLLLVTIVLVADCQVKKPEGKPKGDKDKPKGDKGGKPSKEKIEKWKENRSKPNNGERKAGGAKLGLFKKGAAFEMDRKNKAIRFEIFDIVETKLDNTTKTYKIEDKEFDIEKTMNDSSYGVASDMTEINATLENNATVHLSMLIFKENGTIKTDDGYEFNVLEGNMKFNLKLEWPYETTQLEPTFRLKCLHGKAGKKGKKEKKSKGKKLAGSKGKRAPQAFGFCEAVRVTFQSTYKSDNNEWRDMPEEYPITKMSEGSGWSTIKLQFTGKTLIYDPITEVGDDIIVEVEDTGMTGTGMKGTASVLMLFFGMLLVKIFGN